MAGAQVKRDVVITLKVMAEKGNKGAAESAKRLFKEVEKAEVAASQRGAEAAASAEREKTSRRKNMARATVEAINKEVSATKKAEAEKAKAYKVAADKAREAQEKVQDANQKTVMAGRTAADGLVTAAGGLVTLGIASEESLEGMVRGLTKVRGAVDTFKGVTDVFFGIRDGMRAWRAAVELTTKANVALAASNALVSSSGGAASVTGGGVKKVVATGVATTAATAAGSVAGGAAKEVAKGGTIAAITGVATKFGAGIGKLAAPMAAVAGKAAALGVAADLAQAGVTKVANSMGITTRESEMMIGALYSWRKASVAARKSAEEVSRMEEERAKKLADQAAANQEIQTKSGMKASLRQSREVLAARRQDVGASDSESAENARLRAIREIEQAEAEVDAAAKRAEDRKARNQFALSADAIQASERLKLAYESRSAAEERSLAIAKSALETQKAKVEAVQNELNAAKERVQAEEDAVNSAEARFGRLGRGEQARLRQIGDKVQLGEDLSKAEIEVLERTGFGQEQVQSHYEKQGEQAGAGFVLDSLGEFDGLKEAQEAQREAQGKVAEELRKHAEKSAQMQAAQDRYIEVLNKLTAANEESLQRQAEAAGVSLGPALGADVENEVAALGATIKDALRTVNDELRRDIEAQAAQGGRV